MYARHRQVSPVAHRHEWCVITPCEEIIKEVVRPDGTASILCIRTWCWSAAKLFFFLSFFLSLFLIPPHPHPPLNHDRHRVETTDETNKVFSILISRFYFHVLYWWNKTTRPKFCWEGQFQRERHRQANTRKFNAVTRTTYWCQSATAVWVVFVRFFFIPRCSLRQEWQWQCMQRICAPQRNTAAAGSLRMTWGGTTTRCSARNREEGGARQ